MTDLAALFDSYSLRARLYPALLTMLPGVVLALAAIPALSLPGVAGTLTTLAVSFGLLYLLADVARARGVNVQAKLLDEWGGWPTTKFLRRDDPTIPDTTKDRYRLFLSQRVPNWIAPTADDEASDPAVSSSRYDSAVHWLKEQTRGEGFSLVHRENANYGFRRNLLGLKPVGICLAIITLLAGAGLVLSSGTMGAPVSNIRNFDASLVPASLWASLGFSVLALGCWSLIIRFSYVWGAAVAYAKALLASCDKL